LINLLVIIEVMKVIRVATVPEAIVHFKKQILYFKNAGIDISILTSPGPYSKVLKDEIGVPHNFINIRREISLLSDILSVYQLFIYFRQYKPDVVHSTTPKAGLLVAIAAFLACVPKRFHTFTGQRWMTLKGPLRTILKCCDRIIVLLNTQCFADSPSQIIFLENENIASVGKIKCIHKGCLGGIDFERFNFERLSQVKIEKRRELGLKDNSTVFIFVGRLNRDKGINELVRAFERLIKDKLNTDLLLIGESEDHLVPLDESVKEVMNTDPSIHVLGFQRHPEEFYITADIFCMPSYREGFGTVVLEAAALGLPAIGTRIPGLVDAISEGESGLLVPPGDTDSLYRAMSQLVLDKEMRLEMSKKALTRARKDFSFELIAEELLKFYR